ncbi:BTAD domain-containing putative transcriptional regulator [Actinocatenispora rupis]|uniref:SARP family transcriptional regulator n=1 Tax=Actinocatenispora rupis TaxID=519421 RepID=A0A8J3J2C3_9ACTN|nr:SARP family transcriptional regulator [Actinocatenispora rupis]
MAVGLLGPFEVRVDGRAVPVPAGRQRVLLAALALSAGRVVSVDALAEALWGADQPHDPRNAVQVAVFRLRRLLGPDRVRTVPGGYRLDLDRACVDALRFVDLADDPEAALALWRGEPLTGVPSDALHRDHVPGLTEAYLAAMERRDPVTALADLHELTARYPLRESLWLGLLTGLARTGRQAEALAGYDRVRRLLADSLGTDPSPELRRLHRELLDADLAGARSGRGDPLPVPRQLPPDLAGFTGRDADLAALDEAASGGLVPLPDNGSGGRAGAVVAVHGAGGVGKTALAVRWAHRVADRFPDGQLHLDLRGYGPDDPVAPDVALDVLLRALGVPPKRVPAGTAERSALLRTRLADRRVLLLLDNARDADQVRPLLPGGANLVLVTSRSELRGLAVRDGAVRHHLHELPDTESVALVRSVLGAARTAGEPAAVAELVALCGNLPLAIVIAAQQAARYPDWALAESVAELRAARDRLDALGDGTDPATDPRTVFSWSYDALDPDAARAFRCLGAHPAPEVELGAAAALLGQDTGPTRRLLDRLVSVHLVGRSGPRRYRLHDLVHLFAAERADADPPGPDATARLLDWYRRTVDNARIAAFGSAPVETPGDGGTFTDGAEAVRWYERNRPTLLAVLRHALDTGYDAAVVRLAWLLQDLQSARHHAADKLRCADAAVRAADRSGDSVDRARARFLTGCAQHSLGANETAIDWHRRALAELPDDPGLASSIRSAMGLAQLDAGDQAGAIESQSHSVRIARGLGRPLRLAHSLLNLAVAEDASGAHARSADHNREALALYRAESATYHEGLVLANLSENMLALARYDEALAYAADALRALSDVDDTFAVPNALIAHGRALAAVGRTDDARAAYRRAHDILDRADQPRVAEAAELLAGLDAPQPARP